MNMLPRRILSEAERNQAKRPMQDDSFVDLAAFYLDCIFDEIDFSQELLMAVLVTLTPDSCGALSKAFFPEQTGKDAGALPREDSKRDPIRLGQALINAWDTWERREKMGKKAEPSIFNPERIKEATGKAFRACHAGRDLLDPCPEQRARLSSIFGLCEPEIEILVFLWCAANNQFFRFLLNDLSLSEYHRALASCAGVDLKTLKNLLTPRSKLIEMGFVQPDFMPPPHYALGDEIRQFFCDPETLFSFVVPLEKFMGQTSSRTVPLDSFPVSELSKGVLEAILHGKKASILIHGAPGTGKTTFVTSLIHSQGLQAFILSAVGGNDDSRSPLLRLKVAAHLARNAKAILVIDEADGIINTRSRGSETSSMAKAWLTEFMDCHSGTIIWIANDVDYVHDAVKRRFVYSLEFKPQNERQRVGLWRQLVGDYGFEGTVDQQSIESLSKSHAVNAGGIDIALRGLRYVLPESGSVGLGPQEPVAVLSEILSRHEILMTGETSLERSRPVREDRLYIPEALNVDMPLSDIVSGLSEVARCLKRRQEHETNVKGYPFVEPHDERSEILEAKLLFSGGPGTGKTAFARRLSTELGLPLVQKRASELLSPYVGMTEQNIASAFEEAEATGAILLLDEADSLFLDRSRAERSWERSQTNELLTRMEAFMGILICCTNRREDFDQAAMRRFQWKLTFSPPLPAQLQELYRRYFTNLCGEPDEDTLASVCTMDGLCPGDFASVFKALMPLSAIRRNTLGETTGQNQQGDYRISHEEVLARLRLELGCRKPLEKQRIGFGV